MAVLTKQELLTRIFKKDYESLKGETLRLTRVRVPGREVCLAHVLSPNEASIYRNLGLTIGTHEGEDHRGEAIGLMRFTPWEAVIAAADIALKAANVSLGFLDRFNGCLILTGQLSDVETAVKQVTDVFRDELGFPVCRVYRS